MSETVHSITLVTGDHQSFPFECGADETILDAAGRAGLTLSSSCRQGACGACLGFVQQGDFRMGEHSEKALPQASTEPPVLLCRTYPTSALAVRVTANAAQVSSGPVPVRSAQVVANEDIGGGVRRLLLEIIPDPIEGVGAPFEAGQFMELEIPELGLWRAYSLSNAPNWDGQLEFLIRLQPNGAFSTWLTTQAHSGQVLRVRGPQGSMVLDNASLAPRCFIAGGTGVAPLLSMLRQMVEFGDMTPTHLYFGVTAASQIFAQNELAAVRALLPGLRVTTCVDRPDGADGTVFIGSPVEAWAADQVQSKGSLPDVYVCGPAGLIDAVEARAASFGIASQHVHSERFLPS